ncbi:hypothetical protein H0H92_008673 [Tricholoma furcatifolium]|nr:hypothetical protein H0H92_008673 [Tricholoma furcatifolium]
MADIWASNSSNGLPSTSTSPTPPLGPSRISVNILSLGYDVLLNVFETLEEMCNSDSQSSKKSLLSAALTCSVLRDPAIDILWKSMDSIFPLLRLLPTVELVNGVYMICGVIRDENMSRFRFYAHKIRHYTRLLVDHGGNQYAPIAPSVYALLEPVLHLRDLVLTSVQALSAPETPFFIPYCSMLGTFGTESCVCAASPLQWVGPPEASLSITSSSTLQRVEIRDPITDRNLDDDFSRMRPFIYALQTRAPRLRDLVISIQTSPSLWELIVDFKNLRSLEFSGFIDAVTLRRLAIALPELRRLVINFLDTLPISSSFPVPHPDYNIAFPFDKLRTLRITGRGSTIASYLPCIRSRMIEDFAVTIDADLQNPPRFSALEQWDICISVLREQGASTLRSVHFETSQKVHIQPLSMTFFNKLSAISLKYIEIEAKISMQDCKTLSRSLNTITGLHIYLVSGSSPIPDPPNEPQGRPWDWDSDYDDVLRPAIFVKFARNCGNLLSMELAFEGAFPSFSLPHSTRVSHHPLRTLSIASGDILDLNNLQHAISVARLLHTVFPSLETLRTPNSHPSAAFWGHVYQLHKEFRGLTTSTTVI